MFQSADIYSQNQEFQDQYQISPYHKKEINKPVENESQ